MSQKNGGKENQQKTIDKLAKSEHDLRERIKELKCLYGISKVAEDRDISVDDLITEVVTGLIPPAFQYPEITAVSIAYDGKVYKTDNFRETQWRLSTTAIVAEKPLQLDVYYLQDAEYLEFEHYLVNDIGNRLKVIIENREEFKKQLLDARVKALTELNEQLAMRVMERGTISDIDPIDKQIISLLSKDGRMKLVDIGEKLAVKDKQGYSHVGVKNRITKLIDNETIAIQANVNLKKFNAVLGILLIETATAADASKIVGDYKDCPRIVFSFRSIGKYNLVFGILGDNIEKLEEFINGSSPRTASGVRDAVVVVSTTFFMPKFFPVRYFDKDVGECTRYKDGACTGCPGVIEQNTAVM
ncbi:MAG TPA: hypothetical protein VKM55_27560 [Candidatus Lokiarchaeia archaeon]|nr:hypothetical protein [Candidatus Lokiarchaeia archaeon]